jgi:uncharacterized protein (TIGR01777 family)
MTAFQLKVVIPGGSGQVGTMVARELTALGHEVVILSRQPATARYRTVRWDGVSLGGWQQEIDGCDVVVNMAGRSVNCRYTERSRHEILGSRVASTRVIGQAIGNARRPPRLWLQAGTATIYSHRFDAPNDEFTGAIGGDESNAPRAWHFSIDVARAWEDAFNEMTTPHTRKVLLRSAMTLSPDAGGVFDTLVRLAKRGLGGRAGDGHQFMSWIHERDFLGALNFLIDRQDVSGVVNLASPNPLPNDQFMRILRDACDAPFGLPSTRLMLEIGALFMRTETELVLKSRRVVPSRLLQHGFQFEFAEWPAAARDLCERWEQGHAPLRAA